MGGSWFNFIPLVIIFFGTILLLVGGVEVGSWLARHFSDKNEEKHLVPIGSLVTAILGLLAFILAFTFSMTASRYEQRRQLMLDESNAIGSAYHTAALLPSPAGDTLRRLLSEYVDVRLNVTLKNVRERIARSVEIHRQLWAHTQQLMNDKMESDIRTLFVGNLIQIFNFHQSRKTIALSYRIPGAIWFSLYVLAFISMMAIGYQVGMAGSIRLRGMSVLAFAIALVIYMIADLDRPSEGQFQVSDQSLRDIKEMINNGDSIKLAPDRISRGALGTSDQGEIVCPVKSKKIQPRPATTRRKAS